MLGSLLVTRWLITSHVPRYWLFGHFPFATSNASFVTHILSFAVAVFLRHL